MAVKEHSLDISAKFDMQEMKNAVIQAQKEIENRYDFKGISKDIDLNIGAKSLTLVSASDNKIDAMLDIMISKMNKRGIKCGFTIGYNSLGYGAVIPHYGTIVVGSTNKLGN